MKIMSIVLLLALTSGFASAADNFDEFRLTLHFVNGTKDTSNGDLEVSRIQSWIEEAEKQYATKPRLKISYTIERKTTVASRDLSSLTFNGMAEFNKFMDEHFDNQAKTETEGHLTLLVGNTLCWNDLLGKQKCWGGWANFPHDVNPFNRKKGIWLSEGSDKYLLTHELGHFFSLKHTFEPYIGLNKQCNKDFANKNLFNPDLGHCNSCNGKIAVRDGRSGNQYYVCEGGVSNVMDYCSSLIPDEKGEFTVTGPETLNTCQQERAANQRQQFMTKDGKVDYVKLAGLRGEGQCEADTDCADGEFCTAGILNLTRNVCKPKSDRGTLCTTKRQCASDRCSWGVCADPDECRADADCGSGNYCGDPISGKRTCKDKLSDGSVCIKDQQCQAGRCKTGFCSALASASMGESCRSDDECREGKCNAPVGGVTKGTCVCSKDSDCGTGKWCDEGFDAKVNACRPKLDKGEKCGAVGTFGNDHKCKSGTCSGLPNFVCK